MEWMYLFVRAGRFGTTSIVLHKQEGYKCEQVLSLLTG